MGSAIYAYLFAVLMAANATSVYYLPLMVVDWVAVAWLFYAGTIATLHHFKSRDIIEVDWYDEE